MSEIRRLQQYFEDGCSITQVVDVLESDPSAHPLTRVEFLSLQAQINASSRPRRRKQFLIKRAAALAGVDVVKDPLVVFRTPARQSSLTRQPLHVCVLYPPEWIEVVEKTCVNAGACPLPMKVVATVEEADLVIVDPQFCEFDSLDQEGLTVVVHLLSVQEPAKLREEIRDDIRSACHLPLIQSML